jgi:hypothetical protein
MDNGILSIKGIPQLDLQIIKLQTQALVPGVLLPQITRNFAINLTASHSTHNKRHAPGVSFSNELASSLDQFGRLDMVLLPLLARQLL